MGKHLKNLDQSTNAAEMTGGWGLSHAKALSTLMVRSEFEVAISDMLNGLMRYADTHAAEYGSPIGEDGVLGEEWASIARGLRGLLNGNTGRIDCGTVDALLCAALKDEGFEP